MWMYRGWEERSILEFDICKGGLNHCRIDNIYTPDVSISAKLQKQLADYYSRICDQLETRQLQDINVEQRLLQD